MPEKIEYPEPGWSAGKMRRVGEAMEMGARVQRQRLSVGDICPTCGTKMTEEAVARQVSDADSSGR